MRTKRFGQETMRLLFVCWRPSRWDSQRFPEPNLHWRERGNSRLLQSERRVSPSSEINVVRRGPVGLGARPLPDQTAVFDSKLSDHWNWVGGLHGPSMRWRWVCEWRREGILSRCLDVFEGVIGMPTAHRVWRSPATRRSTPRGCLCRVGMSPVRRLRTGNEVDGEMAVHHALRRGLRDVPP